MQCDSRKALFYRKSCERIIDNRPTLAKHTMARRRGEEGERGEEKKVEKCRNAWSARACMWEREEGHFLAWRELSTTYLPGIPTSLLPTSTYLPGRYCACAQGVLAQRSAKYLSACSQCAFIAGAPRLHYWHCT